MQILLFTSAYPPLVGGVETVTRRLARELSSRGHEVTVVTNRYPHSLAPREEMDGLPVIRRLYPNLLPSPGRRSMATLVKQVLSVPLAAVELARLSVLLRRLRPDVVNVHYFSYPSAYALLAARSVDVPAVLSFHGSDVPASPYPSTYSWAARWGCGLSDGIVCCSSNLRSYLVRDLRDVERDRPTVIYSGIDVPSNPTAARSKDQEPFVLLSARLVEKKGVSVAIEAMKLLHESRPDAKLVIAGTGPLDDVLRKLARSLGVADRIEFAGSIPHNVLADMLRQALFVIVPSHWEAFGMVALEAMAAGKAVVGSRNGGMAEIIVNGHTGLLVPPGEPEALAAAMSTLIENPDLAQTFGAEGRRRASDTFSWAHTAERYEASFDSAIQRRRHSDA